MTATSRLPQKPEARTEKVEDLVAQVRRGRVRVPPFQRGLKWQSSDVVDLFDSIYRGYPIGSLLFYKRSARAETIALGPLPIAAPEIPDAWWVVDGQQRVTTLAVCLARPLPLPQRPGKDDPFVVYFDPRTLRFEAPPRRGDVPDAWVPLPQLLDASQLSEWVYAWPYSRDEDLRRAVFEAGQRLREYPIPLYLIETEDPAVAKEIFYRVNQAGKPLEWTEIHDALFGGGGSSPATLEELAQELGAVGMGRLGEKRLLTCLVALRGKDPTRTLAEHLRRDPQVLSDAVQEAVPVLRRVLSFLRRDAGIPHLRLLPKPILLDVLTRVFALHPDPKPRSRMLLSRWLWRTILGAGAFDDRTLRRRGIAAVGDDEEESIQRLLALVRRERPRAAELPQSFDPRADGSRLALLALAHLGPRDLGSGEPLDVARLIEAVDKAAFRKIVDGGSSRTRGAANRLIQPPSGTVGRLLRRRLERNGAGDGVLASHAIDEIAAERLAADDAEGFLRRRAEVLVAELQRLGERMAAWDHSDRPSIDHLLAAAGVDG